MTKSPAQRQREYMERKKEQDKRASLSLSDVFRRPFFEFAKADANFEGEFDVALGLAGIMAPSFDNDDPPEQFVLDHATSSDDPFGRLATASGQGSLPRAEIMIDLLLGATRALSSVVHDYKKAEISVLRSSKQPTAILLPVVN